MTTEQLDATGASIADRYGAAAAISRDAHVVVNAPPSHTLRAAKQLDFEEVPGPLVRAILWVRRIPKRLSEFGSWRQFALPEPGIRRVDEPRSEWVLLEESPTEIVSGVVGRFWTPVSRWLPVEPERFADFAEPGYGKVVMSLSARPYGDGRCLLSHDIRIVLSNPADRRHADLYWMTVKPFVGAVQRAILRAVKSLAEAPTTVPERMLTAKVPSATPGDR